MTGSLDPQSAGAFSSGRVGSTKDEGSRVAQAGSGGALRGYLGEPQLFLLLAIVIGVFSGLAVVCFRIAYESARDYFYAYQLFPHGVRSLYVPASAGLVIAVLVIHVFPAVRGSGVNQTKAALYIYDGRIPFRTVIGKFLTSALAIASGQSLGPEDPSLQVGAGLASAIGRRLRLSRERLRLIAPLGAAAGLAAAFNAPISAVLFVIEEVIGNWSAAVLGSVVLSAVSATVVARAFLGGDPLFRIPQMEPTTTAELPAFAALGVFGGIASVLFLKIVLTVRPRLKALPRWTQYFQPALAGLIIGIIAQRYPQVMGAGYAYVDMAMHGEFTWKLLLLLAALKLVSTFVSFVSGTPGGLFAPTLFLGAMLGAGVGSIERQLFPHHAGTVAAFALVGMGTMFAGILRAPMTSVFMMLEVSGSYEILLPVMLSNGIAYLISRSMQPLPIFDVLSHQDGLDLPSLEAKREEAELRVEDATRPNPLPVFYADEALAGALPRLKASMEDFVWIYDLPSNWYLVAREAVMVKAAEGAGTVAAPATTLRDLLPPEAAPHMHPDHPLEQALQHTSTWVFLPVLSRADSGRLLGVLTFEDVMRTYGAHSAGSSSGSLGARD